MAQTEQKIRELPEEVLEFRSILEALNYWNETSPQKIYCHTENLVGNVESLTFSELHLEAERIAALLKNHNIQKGDCVILALANNKTFLFSFLGILMSGGIPVPVVTHEGFFHNLKQAYTMMLHVLEDTKAKLILTDNPHKKLWDTVLKKNVGSGHILLVEDRPQNHFEKEKTAIFPEDIALIQYTAGSTSLPKGVMITHRQLMYQIKAIAYGLGTSSKDCAVCWLPLFHDMGLIGGFLHTLYVGMRFVLLTCESFLFDPKKWLWAISKHGATLSAAPNSAYNMCVARINTQDIEGLDLSCWKVAFSGAEPLSVETFKKFTEKFKPYGFNPNTILPGYGMAENCLAISFCKRGEGLNWDCVQRAELEHHHRAIPIKNEKERSVCFVSVGKPILYHEIAIMGDEEQILPERHIGEILVKGPCVMAGYFHNYEETVKTIHNNWLYTGDLGYIAGGNLYITGRKKDLIIVGGRNYYPQDLEQAAEEVVGVRKGCVIAVGLYDEALGTEKSVVLAEIKPEKYKETEAITQKISHTVFNAVGIVPDKVLLYRAGTLYRTTSGKLQRSKYKQMLEEGELIPSITFLDRIRYFKFRLQRRLRVFFYLLKAKLFR